MFQHLKSANQNSKSKSRKLNSTGFVIKIESQFNFCQNEKNRLVKKIKLREYLGRLLGFDSSNKNSNSLI